MSRGNRRCPSSRAINSHCATSSSSGTDDDALNVAASPCCTDAASVQRGLAATFSPASSVSPDELVAQWQLIARADGHRLLPRLIRYIEERRRDEARYTGAIESHPSPLHVVWGVDDPIAVVAMSDRLRAARPDAVVELLDGVGHYPMIESPARFAAAVRRGLQPAA